MGDLPAPLTPADCDLRPFRDMPLDIGRFRRSDLVTEEEPEAVVAALMLWGAAWHEVPASSVPDNDRWLAKAAGYGRAVDSWLRVKAGAMRGFVLCSDGRWYNKTLAEKANESWDKRQQYEWRKAGDRHRKSQRELPEPERTKFPDYEVWLSDRSSHNSDGKDDLFRRNEPGIPTENALKGREGKGREGRLVDSQAKACVGSGASKDDSEEKGAKQPPPPARPKPEDFVEIWNELAIEIGRPTIKALTGSRSQILKARLAQFKPNDFWAVFDKIRASPFLRGDTDRWGGVTFDWVIKQANFIKIWEGNYDQ